MTGAARTNRTTNTAEMAAAQAKDQTEQTARIRTPRHPSVIPPLGAGRPPPTDVRASGEGAGTTTGPSAASGQADPADLDAATSDTHRHGGAYPAPGGIGRPEADLGSGNMNVERSPE